MRVLTRENKKVPTAFTVLELFIFIYLRASKTFIVLNLKLLSQESYHVAEQLIQSQAHRQLRPFLSQAF